MTSRSSILGKCRASGESTASRLPDLASSKSPTQRRFFFVLADWNGMFGRLFRLGYLSVVPVVAIGFGITFSCDSVVAIGGVVVVLPAACHGRRNLRLRNSLLPSIATTYDRPSGLILTIVPCRSHRLFFSFWINTCWAGSNGGRVREDRLAPRRRISVYFSLWASCCLSVASVIRSYASGSAAASVL
jgi:hypothetical protein